MKRTLLLASLAGALGAAAIAAAALTNTGGATAAPVLRPAITDVQRISAGTTPPTEAQCTAVGRTCFTPQALYSAYNIGQLHAAGLTGAGMTIAVVDSWGSDTMAHDLHVFDQAFGLPPMCGEEGVKCTPGMPKFTVFHANGAPATKAPSGNGTGQEDKTLWALEVALDVEMAHAIAPGANIVLVASTGAETLGVQGLPNMMKAEKFLIDNGLVDVISQSFGTAEDAFASTQSLLNLRDAFTAAKAKGVTVLASSGDDGSAGSKKPPVAKGGAYFPFPVVGWPASDPLVTSVGGTYLCTDPFATALQPRTNGTTRASRCNTFPNETEVGWTFSGGGFSHVFAKPDYQNTLPAGSTPIGSMRGVPDVAYQASAGTGALVYLSLPPDGDDSNIDDTTTGWWDIGGTSLSTPQWAGLVAIADQINGGGLGLINPALYRIGADPARYAADFFDVTTGNNTDTVDPPTPVPGYPATRGWDPVTGLGTPNAARLLPDLVAAAHGH
ncbi:MAG: S8 family serine peptidase [Gaiellaceae bacterium]|jgi:subtilase family serine protease